MILVTGATGFIGRSLTRQLTAANLPFKPFTEDINHFVALREQLSGVETVIHLAGAEATGRLRPLRRTDVEGTETLLKALRQRSIKQLVVISRLNASPNGVHLLLRAKGLVEQAVQRSGVPYTIVRSATCFGRYDRLTNAIAATAAWSFPVVYLPNGGTTAMQPIWVEDTARCIVATIGNDALLGKTVTIAGRERLHYSEIVTTVLLAANIRRYQLNVRSQVARGLNRLSSWMFRRPPLNRFDHDRFSAPEVADLNTVYDQFGFRAERLGDHLAHLRAGGHFGRIWQM
jgi:NADH dehydrogenase